MNICNNMDWINRAELRFYSRWTEIVKDISAEEDFADRTPLRRSLLKPSSSPKYICTRNFRSFPLSLVSFNRWMAANFPVVGA